MGKSPYCYGVAVQLIPLDLRIVYYRGATQKYEPPWVMIYSGSYSFTIQTSVYIVARLSCTNGLKKTQNQPESRRDQLHLPMRYGPLITPIYLLLLKCICKRTRSPHPSTPSDHAGGYTISRANPGPSRCSSTNACALPLSHASQWREFRKFEWRSTDSKTEEETTGITNSLFTNQLPTHAQRSDSRETQGVDNLCDVPEGG